MTRKKDGENNSPAALGFEEALSNLELIVKQLETGDLPLEESLAKFSEGIILSRTCMTKLNAAEKQIDKILREDQGEIIEVPLRLPEDKDGE